MAPSANQLRPGVVAEWVDPKEEQALTADVTAQLANLPTVIDNPETYRRVVESLPLLKRAEDKVTAFFKDIKDAANKAHKAITAKESEQLRPIVAARQRLSQLKYGYEQEQNRIKVENERLAAEHERQRREAAALEEADAIAAASPELAEHILQEAITAPPPVVVLPSVTAAVEVAGVGKSKPRWVWRYQGAPDHETPWKKLDPALRKRLMALIARDYLMPDESAIGKIVTATDGNVKIPGIEVYDIGSTTVRG